MSQTNTQVVPAVVVRRTYQFPRQRVFDAWTDAKTAAKFLCTKMPSEIAQMDVRTGGAYRIIMHTQEGDWAVFGTYREVRPPERISFTWRWDEDNPADAYDSLVTLDFNEIGPNETELVLTHEQLRTQESRDNHEEGWTQIVDQLSNVLA